jgi:hypothetical protein
VAAVLARNCRRENVDIVMLILANYCNSRRPDSAHELTKIFKGNALDGAKAPPSIKDYRFEDFYQIVKNAYV